MTTYARRQLLALFPFVFVLLLLGGCAGTGSQTEQTATGTFPVPPEIQGNVDFWSNVYGNWGRNQVAFHDDEYLGAVYEVATIPGWSDGGSGSQQRFIRARHAYYAGRLRDLEGKVRAGQALSPEEAALQKKLVDAGGQQAIFGAGERVRAQRGVREKFRRGMEISGRYDRTFREIFRTKGLPEDLAFLPHVESSFQVNARSGVGAAGVWQFMPGTGKVYGMNVGHAVDDRLDPVIAAEGAARYLDQAYRKLGSWPLAVTSYNHGQGGMQKAKGIYGNDFGRIARHYNGASFGFDSRNFYAQFVAAREVAGNPRKYFPDGVRYEAPLEVDRLVLRESMPAHHVAGRYGLSTYRLADLNLHLRASARDGRALVPAGTTLWLPQGALRGGSDQLSYKSDLVARTEPAPSERAALDAFADSDSFAMSQSASTPASERMAGAAFADSESIAMAQPAPKSRPTASVQVAKAEPAPKPAAAVKVAKAEPMPRPASDELFPMSGPAPKPAAAAKVAKAEPIPMPVTEELFPMSDPAPKPAAVVKVAKAEPIPRPATEELFPMSEPASKPAVVVKVAKTEPAPKPATNTKVAKAEPAAKPATDLKVAKAEAAPKPAVSAKVAKAEPAAKPATDAKLAKAEPAPKPAAAVKVAEPATKPATNTKVAKAEPAAKPAASAKVAKAEPAPKPATNTKVAKAEPAGKSAAGAKVAKAEPPAKADKGGAKATATKPVQAVMLAKAEKSEKPATGKEAKASGQHVVQANETLYRVASRYDMSVEELRRLNRMRPDENSIRPGQKLRVSI